MWYLKERKSTAACHEALPKHFGGTVPMTSVMMGVIAEGGGRGWCDMRFKAPGFQPLMTGRPLLPYT